MYARRRRYDDKLGVYVSALLEKKEENYARGHKRDNECPKGGFHLVGVGNRASHACIKLGLGIHKVKLC